MAKSANNFYTVRDLEEKYKNISSSLLYRAIRLSFMNARYRDSVDFSFEKLEQNFTKSFYTHPKLHLPFSFLHLPQQLSQDRYKFYTQKYQTTTISINT